MLDWLTFWRKRQPKVSENQDGAGAVSESLVLALASRQFSALSVELREWCRQPQQDFALLRNAAQAQGWDGVALDKLAIFFQYYNWDVTQAFEAARRYMDLHGFDLDLHVISLVCLYQNNQFEEAWQYAQRQGIEQREQFERSDYWQMLTVILWANNRMEELGSVIRRTIMLAQGAPEVLHTAFTIAIELGDDNLASDLKLRIDEMPRSHGYAYALGLLAYGHHDRGWRMMETRYELEDAQRYINQGLKPFPRWQGEPLINQRLMISAEQGLGDTIQMARYLPMLQANGSEGVLLETQLETLTLLQYNFPDIPMVERRWAQAPDLVFDRWTGMMSLPYLLKAWGKYTPGRAGYLRVPPENAQYWIERVEQLSPTKKPRIGLAWSGQPNHRADRRRSIPFELMMRHVRGIKASFFALQTQVPQVLPANVINVSEEMITLADTAALIEQMDMVITVDTSVVHIAGALGKKTWLLLPKRYEWRWGLEGEENDWYDTVKVIRQTEHANWGLVLRDVFERRLPDQFNL